MEAFIKHQIISEYPRCVTSVYTGRTLTVYTVFTLQWISKIHWQYYRGGSRIFHGGWPNPKKWGQFGPCGPHIAPNLVLQLGILVLGPHFCLYGPDFSPKLALFMTKIRIVLIKYHCFGPKKGAFSCRGGGQGPLAPAPGSAPDTCTLDSAVQSKCILAVPSVPVYIVLVYDSVPSVYTSVHCQYGHKRYISRI